MKAISPWYGSSGYATANGSADRTARADRSSGPTRRADRFLSSQIGERPVGRRGRVSLDPRPTEVIVEVIEPAGDAELLESGYPETNAASRSPVIFISAASSVWSPGRYLPFS